MVEMKLEDLKARLDSSSPREAETILFLYLQKALESVGFETHQTPHTQDRGIDYTVTANVKGQNLPHTMGIEYKSTKKPIGIRSVRELLGAGILGQYDNIAMISKAGFTKPAKSLAEKELPLRLTLLGTDQIHNWVSSLNEGTEAIDASVSNAIKVLSGQFAMMVAKNPEALRHLEWRDVERMFAEVFEGLGFQTTLTPSSKDGGKDIVLNCKVKGINKEYYVEVKHWRSSTKVGQDKVDDFVSTVIRDNVSGGLFLSSYGYTENAFEAITEIRRNKLNFGGHEKAISLCKTYSRSKMGIWSPPENLSEIVMSEP